MFISFDVEPDAYLLQRGGGGATTGYDAAVELAHRLRPRLADATGRPPSFGWFFRMEPQITQVYGRPDHLVTGFGDRVDRLLDAGDHVGLHTHPIRWDDGRQTWVHDHADAAWLREAFTTGFDAFERCFGVPCERHRIGGGMFDQVMVDLLEDLGARVETSLESERSWRVPETEMHTAVDYTPIVGAYSGVTGAPRVAYRPAAGDWMRPARRPDGVAIVPVTSTRLRERESTPRAAVRVVHRRAKPRVDVLFPSSAKDPNAFWDMVLRQTRLMRRPFVNLALRTDVPESGWFERARAAFEALPDHPLARRVEIGDPLDALPQLLRQPVAPPIPVRTVQSAN